MRVLVDDEDAIEARPERLALLLAQVRDDALWRQHLARHLGDLTHDDARAHHREAVR